METTGTRSRRAPYGNQSHQIQVRSRRDHSHKVQVRRRWQQDSPVTGEAQVEPESPGTEEAKVRTRVTRIRSVPEGNSVTIS